MARYPTNMIPRHFMLMPSVAFFASLAGVYLGASWSNRWLVAASAFLFSTTISVAAFFVLRRFWRGEHASAADHAAKEVVVASTQFSALVYAWGAAALFLVYTASGLRWQHGWQYGVALALVATGMAQYLKLLRQDQPSLISSLAISRVVMLATSQGVSVSLVVLWLVASGKIISPRADWAANLIFVAGGLAIICLSAFLTKSHNDLTRTKDVTNLK